MPRDRRYTIQRMWCGYPRQQHVVQFCDEWVGCAPNRAGAIAIRAANVTLRAAQIAALAP